jgi:hypothetical protein
MTGGFLSRDRGVDGRRITSYVVTLRNPIDRLISAFRYNHPEGCKHLGGDCGTSNQLKGGKNARMTLAYQSCFPTLNMELFAQSAMSPWDYVEKWNTTENADRANTTTFPKACLPLARDMIKGKRRPAYNLSPHMYFNYEYYAEKSFDQFPHKEVFGVRTTNEWEDIIHLDLLLGGSGNFTNKGESHFHGKDKTKPFTPPPISTEATHKLCCVLWKDIAIYLKLWERVLNFNQTLKQENEASLRAQCGVSNSWSEWTTQCKAHLEQDEKLLEGVEY